MNNQSRKMEILLKNILCKRTSLTEPCCRIIINAFSFNAMQTKKTCVKERILAAAREAFQAGAFDSVSMRSLARAAGISPGNLYTYFGGKEDLYYVLLCEEQDRRLESMFERIGARDSGRGKLEAYAEAYYDYALAKPEVFRKDLEWFVRGGDEGRISPGVLEELAESRRLQAERFLQMVREGQADGSLAPDLDPVLFMKHYTMCLRLVINETAVLGCEPKPFFEAFVRLIMDGAASAPGDSGKEAMDAR